MSELIYILSPGHSGSTLLGLLLGTHPEIATVGELKAVPTGYRQNELCSCGSRMRECGFWKQVTDVLQRENLDLASDCFRTHVSCSPGLGERVVHAQVRSRPFEMLRSALLRCWPQARRERAHLLDCNAAMIRSILALTGCRHFLDTSKDASRLRLLCESGLFRVRVIHLIRDGRAVSYSMVRKSIAPRAAALEWVREHVQAGYLRRSLVDPSRWLQLHYEQLCEDTAGALARVCRFLGIAEDGCSLDYRGWDDHVLGNRLRCADTKRIVTDMSWREQLRGETLHLVERVAGRLNRQFGYL